MLLVDSIWCHSCNTFVEGLHSIVDVLKKPDEQEKLVCCRCFSEDVQIVEEDEDEPEDSEDWPG